MSHTLRRYFSRFTIDASSRATHRICFWERSSCALVVIRSSAESLGSEQPSAHVHHRRHQRGQPPALHPVRARISPSIATVDAAIGHQSSRSLPGAGTQDRTAALPCVLRWRRWAPRRRDQQNSRGSGTAGTAAARLAGRLPSCGPLRMPVTAQHSLPGSLARATTRRACCLAPQMRGL